MKYTLENSQDDNKKSERKRGLSYDFAHIAYDFAHGSLIPWFMVLCILLFELCSTT